MTIVLDSLRVVSAGHVLVDDVNLIVEPASRTALVGASGAGKSLTCKALAGILPPDLSVTGSLTVSSVPGRDLLPLPAPPSVRVTLALPWLPRTAPPPSIP
ncbi:ATP-binding cassette domain-containing protein [Actinomyces oricola]